MTSETRKFLDVFETQRKGWTDTGRAAVDELERWLQVGRERFGEWVSDDPAKALAYTSGAGAAILLMGDAYPEFAQLERHLAERRSAGGDGGYADGGDTGDAADDDDDRAGLEADLSGADLDGIDLGTLGEDPGGLDGLDAAFGAIDLGVDAGGGGDAGAGGGDGGGS